MPERPAQLIGELFNFQVSPGSIASWVVQASTTLRDTADVIAEQLMQAAAHADESGLRVEGSLYWLHVVATDMLTWYGVHAKRGMEAIEAHGILPKRLGILVHDCWAPYWNLDCIHVLCNAHLLRELRYVQESTGEVWPTRMTELLLLANQICTAARQQNHMLSADDVCSLRDALSRYSR